MEPDEIIHQSTRLKIMSALNAVADSGPIEFPRLKTIVNASDGNLGAHLATLENAGYVRIEKDFAGRKPRTRVTMTRNGRKAFARHLAYLREVLDGANLDE